MQVPDRDLRCFAEKCFDTVASAEARKLPRWLRSDEKQKTFRADSRSTLS